MVTENSPSNVLMLTLFCCQVVSLSSSEAEWNKDSRQFFDRIFNLLFWGWWRPRGCWLDLILLLLKIVLSFFIRSTPVAEPTFIWNGKKRRLNGVWRICQSYVLQRYENNLLFSYSFQTFQKVSKVCTLKNQNCSFQTHQKLTSLAVIMASWSSVVVGT